MGSGELNIISNGSSGSDDNYLARSQNNISPVTLTSIGERSFTQMNQPSSSQKQIASRGSCFDINIGPDDRDEEPSLSPDTKNNPEQNSINNNDGPDNIVFASPKPTKTIIKRNDSIPAKNIDDVDVSIQPKKNSVRLHILPKQERYSLEMKKNILSLLEKDAKHRQKRQGNNSSVGKNSEKDEQLRPSSNNRDKYTETTLIDNSSHGQNLGSGRRRLETEESRASTLSTNDLLNLQRGCALSSTSSCTTDGKSNDDEHNYMGEAAVNEKELIRSGSMEPMIEETPANTKPPPLPPSSVQAEGQQNPSSPLIYRLHNNLSKSPMSDVNSTYVGTATTAKASLGSPCSSTGIAPSLFQDNTDDDIGGDTYFEGQISPRHQSHSTSIEDENMSGSLVNEVGIDDLMTPLPPPRVNRTKNNPIEYSSISPTDSITNTTATSTNTTTTNIADLAAAPLLPLSPRRQTLHTHSLLDDCSDDEDNYGDDDEKMSSSYVIIDEQSSSRGNSSWKRRSSIQGKNLTNISISQQLASNNIQIALLQTRHRRWEVQSTLCGPHAQSKQVFDLSTRVHHIPKFHNRQQQNFSFSPIRTSMFSDADIGDDDGVAFLARLSVPIEAIRAAALGSGLWRTVRLVKLPQGLFGWHWILWKEQRQVPDSVYFGDDMPLDNEVWSLLQMLGDTFPNLEQVDFGGDIAKSTVASSVDEQSIDLADTYNREDWRNEILTCVMQCLPKLIAVDGFAVEIDGGGMNDDPIKSNETQKLSFDGVPLNANDEISERDIHAQDGVRTRKVRCRTSSFNVPNQCDVATETSDAMEDVSENIMSLCGNYVDSDGHSEENNISPAIGEPNSVNHEEKVAQPASSPLSSSFSWGSNGSSGSRPPTCPKSDRRRLPTKPTMKNQMKSKLSKKNKRRLKKLTGLMPSMMDDEEDSDDEELIEGEGAEECPTDLL